MCDVRDFVQLMSKWLPGSWCEGGIQAGVTLINCKKVLLLSCIIAFSLLYYRERCGHGQSRRGEFFFRVEERPDCTEQGAPLKRGVPQTILCGKTSATERRPPVDFSAGKGERVR